MTIRPGCRVSFVPVHINKTLTGPSAESLSWFESKSAKHTAWNTFVCPSSVSVVAAAAAAELLTDRKTLTVHPQSKRDTDLCMWQPKGMFPKFIYFTCPVKRAEKNLWWGEIKRKRMTQFIFKAGQSDFLTTSWASLQQCSLAGDTVWQCFTKLCPKTVRGGEHPLVPLSP